MYTSQQSTDFNLRVGLDNSYCNCFHLMCRVEKSTWYIFKKRALAAQYTVLYVPVSTWKNSESHFLTFSTRLQEIFCCAKPFLCHNSVSLPRTVSNHYFVLVLLLLLLVVVVVVAPDFFSLLSCNYN